MIINKRFLVQALALLLVFLLLSSCKTLTSNRMFETTRNFEYSDFKASQKEYVIQPFDKLTLKIYSNKGERLIELKGGSQNLTNTIAYNVEYDGLVKVPTIGRFKVGGMTIREAEKALEEEYVKYFKDPFVFVEVTNKRVIIFSGGSASGKVVNFSSDNFSLIEALAMSGGMSDVGKAYKIKLLRGDLNNPEIFNFNIRSMKDIKNINFQLQSNDIVYVEDKPRYASKTLRELTPYLTLFTSLFTVYILVTK